MSERLAPPRFIYRVERTEWSEIEVDLAALLASDWGTDRGDFDTDEEFVSHVLWEVGVQDLTYSGDWVKVTDKDTEEDIRRA